MFPPSFVPRPIGLAVISAMVGLSAQAQAPLDAPVDIHITAQPLREALDEWSKQTGIALRADPGLVASKTAPAVAGRMTARQALDRLLLGSGLGVEVRGGAVAVVAQAGAAGATATLPSVTVSGSALSAASEGSGSFIVEATSSATGLVLSPRETPQSLSVITEQRMTDQGMQSVQQALQATTGVSVAQMDGARNSVSARGFDITNFQFDGVPVTTGNVGIETASTAIYDRIEVVRGATGLVNGAGDPSASVNLIRKGADSRVFTGGASIDVGSWNQWDATIDLSAPLDADGSVRARFVAAGGTRDSFVDLDHRKYTVAYGVIDADLGPGTHLRLGASDQRTQRSGVLWAGLPYWYSDGTRTDWPRSKTTAANWNEWDTTEQAAFATLAHRLDNGWTLRADLNWNRQRDDENMLWLEGYPDRVTGEGMEPYPIGYLSEPTQTNVNVSARGSFQAWGREHEAFIAASWGQVKLSWYAQDPADPNVPPTGDFNTWDGTYPQVPMGEPYLGSRTTDEQTAIYGATRLRLTDPLSLILGARVSNFVRKEEAGAWTPEPYEIRYNGVFVPYAGVVADVTSQLSAYASYTDIFKPQAERDRNGKYLDPLTGKSYEVGLKGEFLGGKLFATGAVFRTVQDNYPIPDPGHFVPGTTDPAYMSGRGVVVRGYELELSGEAAPGWNLTAGWTQFSAKDADGVNVAVDHPRKALKFFTAYTFPGAWSGLTIGGGADWQSQAPAEAINPGSGQLEQIGQPAYTLVNLMARYAFNPQVSLQLNVDNLFDKNYFHSTWWVGPFTYGEPRRFLATLDYRF